MKVAPVSSDMIASDAPLSDVGAIAVPPVSTAPKAAPLRDKRAEAN